MSQINRPATRQSNVSNVIDYPSAASQQERGGLWELIGIRVRGVETPILGAVHFQCQERGSRARRALSDYLSNSPVKPGVSATAFPRHLVPLAVKPDDERFLGFTRSLEAGREPRIVHIANECIEVAFDFRTGNPSVEKGRFAHHEPEDRAFRTIEGHVLLAKVAALEEKLHRDARFLGLQQVRQVTGCGTIELPNLIVNREYLTLTAEWSDSKLSRCASFLRPDRDAQTPILGASAYRFFREGREKAVEKQVARAS